LHDLIFSFNMSLAMGGAILGSIFIWTLAFIFWIVAIFGLAKLNRIAQTGEVFILSARIFSRD